MFFGTKSDPQCAKDMLLKQPDLFIQQQKYSGSGVAGIATNDVTLTPAVSPAWTIDEHKSAVGYNIVVQANSGEVFEGPVKSNAATSVTFDATAMKSLKDGTAGAGTDFTTATLYYFYILQPHATYQHGDWFGYAREIEVIGEEETAEFVYGIPEQSIREDLLRAKYSVKGKNFDCMNEDVFNAVFNSVQKGSQTSQWEQHIGFSPASRKWYRITMIGTNVHDKEMMIQFWFGQFKLEGSYALSGREHKGLGFVINAKQDSLQPGAEDVGRMRVNE